MEYAIAKYTCIIYYITDILIDYYESTLIIYTSHNNT